MRTEPQALDGEPVEPSRTAHPWSSGNYAAGGLALVALGVLLLTHVQSSDNGGGNGDTATLGVIAVLLGSPMLLVGLIALGIRLGLKEHAADQAHGSDD